MSFRGLRTKEQCPVCRRIGWCMVARDGTAAICRRVQSNRVVGKLPNNYYHRLDRPLPPAPMERERPPSPVDWSAMVVGYERSLSYGDPLPHQLGVSRESLKRLRYGWSDGHQAWTFPMCDGKGQTIGFRIRTASGKKLAISGSRNGLFIPSELDERLPMTVCEGPTDCAALLDAGMAAIGRPCNTAGNDMLLEYATNAGVRSAVLILDRDEKPDAARDTRRAAEQLARALRRIRCETKIVKPPFAKDARAWHATADHWRLVIDAAIPFCD